MKKIINPGLAIVLLFTLLFTACKKETPPETIPATAPNPANKIAPIANAGNDITIVLPFNSALLDGSASTATYNTIYSYSWKFLSGPSNTIIFENEKSVKAFVKNLIKGTYQFELTVTDTRALSSTDTVQVLVLPFPVRVTDTAIQLPYNRALLQLNSSNNINSFTWKKISGPNSFYIQYPDGKYTSVSNLVEGIYEFEVTETNAMQLSIKDTMTITVKADNNVYSTEILFENLQWNYGGGWGCSTDIFFIPPNNMPVGHPIKVYIKTNLNNDWEIVQISQHDQYNIYEYHWDWGIKNQIYVSGINDENPYGKIKIVY
jgi:hypothetical protein